MVMLDDFEEEGGNEVITQNKNPTLRMWGKGKHTGNQRKTKRKHKGHQKKSQQENPKNFQTNTQQEQRGTTKGGNEGGNEWAEQQRTQTNEGKGGCAHPEIY
jgi:hypothetical protein